MHHHPEQLSPKVFRALSVEVETLEVATGRAMASKGGLVPAEENSMSIHRYEASLRINLSFPCYRFLNCEIIRSKFYGLAVCYCHWNSFVCYCK